MTMTQGILQDTNYKAMTEKQRKKHNKNPNGGTIRREDLRHHDPNLYLGCVPCLFKRLLQGCWGDILICNTQNPTEPLAFPHENSAIFALHQLTQRNFCVDPPGHSDEVADWLLDNDPPSTADVDKYTRNARRENMTGQQDADESQRFLFNGIGSSWDMM
jgi:hypothetical protein